MNVVRKVTVAKAAGGTDMDFVLSDATRDRMGDVIEPKGWSLANFKKNPIALFGHDGRFPIGRWKDIRIEGGELLGRLELAEKGTSERLDEIISLVAQGILRAVSVGFHPIKQEPLKDNSGIYFKEQELLETSLVSVGANPSALQVARSLNTSDEVIGLVFGEHASAHAAVTRGATGELAAIPSHRKITAMIPLSKRVEDAQTRLNALKDQLTDHLAKSGEGEPDDTASAITEELNGKIATAQRAHESLLAAEKTLGFQAEEAAENKAVALRPVWAKPAQKIAPAEYTLRSLVAKVVGQAAKKDPYAVLVERYGQDGRIDEETRTVFDYVQRTATLPATTTLSGWASQLVATSIASFVDLLLPQSVYPGLSSRGLRLNFGRSGIISVPSRTATPTVAGAFVLQGDPIPVKQAAFGAVTLTPKKMAVISVFTREIAEHSTPAIETLIKNAMQEDTSVALDVILLDNSAATLTRPAGIREGVTVTTATAGGAFAALVGDLKGLVGALITASNGNLRSPVWIMNPVQALAISLTQNAGGDFPFSQEISQNRFQGYPVIQSSTVTAGMVILIDAADFVSVEGDAPRFDMSDQATLHMETSPLQIATGVQGSGVLATPTRSLYQTDSIALRMIMDVNWALRRTGVVAWTQAVTW